MSRSIETMILSNHPQQRKNYAWEENKTPGRSDAGNSRAAAENEGTVWR